VKRPPDNSFEELTRAVPATIGIAIARDGDSSVASFGTWSDGVAWSTIKVPLAIASVRAGSASRELLAQMITHSDNPAAEELWLELGDPAEAARRVQAVLDDAGDTTTVVESRRLRPGYTPFGQTRWSLVRQAQFAARLPGIPSASPIVELMHDLCADHRWGLAAKGFAAKGGWGPGMGGEYLVRQFALVPAESGQLGVALAAEAPDGVFATAVDVVDKLTDWLVEEVLTQY
jgi:hypothetical protein